MRCSRAQDLLPEFVGQGLDKATRASLREHLRECASCRKAGSEWLQARKALRAAVAAADAATAIHDASWSAWREDILRAVATDAQRQPKRGLALPRYVSGLAAAAALVCGLLLGTRVEDGLLQRDPIFAQPGHGSGVSLLRPLGQEGWAPTAGGLEWRRRWATRGLRGRLVLRTLEDEFLPLPSPSSQGARAPFVSGEGR